MRIIVIILTFLVVYLQIPSSISGENGISVKFTEAKFDKTGIVRILYNKMLDKINKKSQEENEATWKHRYKFNYADDVLYSFYKLDEVHKFAFIYVEVFPFCGTSGCTTYIFEYKNNKWIKVFDGIVIIFDRYVGLREDGNSSNLYIINKTDFGYHRLMQDDPEDGMFYYCWKNGRYWDDNEANECKMNLPPESRPAQSNK